MNPQPAPATLIRQVRPCGLKFLLSSSPVPYGVTGSRFTVSVFSPQEDFIGSEIIRVPVMPATVEAMTEAISDNVNLVELLERAELEVVTRDPREAYRERAESAREQAYWDNR